MSKTANKKNKELFRAHNKLNFKALKKCFTSSTKPLDGDDRKVMKIV